LVNTTGQRRSSRAWRRLADQELKRDRLLSVESRRQARIETGTGLSRDPLDFDRLNLRVSIRLEEPAYTSSAFGVSAALDLR
jgi:hypothetical protein